MALGLTEGIVDVERAALRNMLTDAGLSVTMAEEDNRESTLKTFMCNHLDHEVQLVAASAMAIYTAIEPFSTYNVLAELLGVAG